MSHVSHVLRVQNVESRLGARMLLCLPGGRALCGGWPCGAHGPVKHAWWCEYGPCRKALTVPLLLALPLPPGPL